jgi:hypothetical protein
MPGAPVRIELGIGSRCERPVHLTPLSGGCATVDRRAQERMAKCDLEAEADQAISLGWSQLLDGDAKLGCRPDEQHRLTRRIGRRHEQQLLRRRGQLIHAALEARLDLTRQRFVAREPKASCQRTRRPTSRQLEQGERVPARFGEYPLAHAPVHGNGDGRSEQFACEGIRKSAEGQLREAAERLESARTASG